MQDMNKLLGGVGEEAGAGGAAPPPPPKVPKAGRRGFAAMFFAQKSGCDCDACKLLRKEITELMTDMMGELAKDDDGTNPES